MSRAYRSYVLAILVVVYTLNFLDRQVIAILAGKIKAEFALTDSQLGLLSGLAFSVVYSTLAIPIALLADRASRVRIMAWALGVWSAFTALCGFAQGYTSLFLCRAGVGVGEAGGVAPAYSVVSDYFPPHQRARALAIYSLGIPIGSACGYLYGGLVADHLDWRWAFIIVGLVGVVIAPVFRATVKDPPRGGFATDGPPRPKAPPARFADVLGILARKPTFWLLAFGAAMASVCGYGIAFWVPSFFERVRGLTLVERSQYWAAVTLIGGCIGMFGGGWLADRFGRKHRAAYPLIPAIAFVVALPCFFLAVNTPDLTLAFPLFVVPTALNLMWLGPVLTAVQNLVPAHMRTTASSMFLLINNLLGIALGNWYFGAVADALAPRYGARALQYALYTGLGFYVLASILFAIGARRIKRDWLDER